MTRYLAELIGTFVLVFAGVGSAVLAGDKIGVLGIALAFGLALLTMVYALGPISGCHLNPAVTLGLLLTRKFEARYAVGYMIAQAIGAILAAGLILVIAQGASAGYAASTAGLGSNGFGAHSPGGYGWGAALTLETILTAFLVLTVLGATDVKAPVGFAGVAIGMMLALTNLVAIPVTNASINPARSLGPAVWVGGWAMGQVWLFILAPLLGACLAAGAYELLWQPGRRLQLEDSMQATGKQQAERQATTPPGAAAARGRETPGALESPPPAREGIREQTGGKY